MSDFLRRFSVSLDRQEQAKSSNHPTADVQGKGGDIPSTHSFNDFSMHVGQEWDGHVEEQPITPAYGNLSNSMDLKQQQHRRSFEVPSPSFVVGSAPSGLSPIATKSLSIPRNSVAQFLWREQTMTPRSSLEAPSTPQEPTPQAAMVSEDCGSPRSPTSPGARRRRQQKIHGLDYYEFCELVRAGSL